MIDNAVTELVAFDTNDHRRFAIRVAGPAALLVAGLNRHLADREAAPTTSRALEFLAQEGTEPTAPLPRLAMAAAVEDPAIAVSFAALAHALLEQVGLSPRAGPEGERWPWVFRTDRS